jgi:hypothetical protein
MEALYHFEMPIHFCDLHRIEQLLEDSGIFTVFTEDFNRYSAAAYRHQQSEFETSFKAYLDLNVLIDVLNVARITKDDVQERRRLGAAVIAFFQCANIQIEPNIAIHESPREAEAEVTLLRKIDNADTIDLLKVAFGDLPHLSESQLPLVKPVSFPEGITERLHGHQAIETAVLKIASLMRHKEQSAYSRMEEFLRWSYQDCIFAREALHLALMQFSGECPGTILKAPSGDHEKFKQKQISNAVWDLMHARNWAKSLSEQFHNNEVLIFCSRDKTLQSLARDLVIDTDDIVQIEHQLPSLFQKYWGGADSLKLFSLYSEYSKNAQSVTRKCNQPGFDSYCKQLRSALIHEVIAG